ncbi:MAG: PSD1 and planctomycete cytochrome C domain-containing protein [Limisphaerales bacterium]
MATHATLLALLTGAALSLSAAEAKKTSLDLSKLPPTASGPVDFARDIQPLFAAKCYSCHGAEKQKGGLRLDIKVAALEGGDNGKVFIPGKSAESKLIHALAGLGETGIMPPKEKPLTPAEIGKVRAWIDGGANWPDDGKLAVKKSDHWAYQAVKRPEVPRAEEVISKEVISKKSRSPQSTPPHTQSLITNYFSPHPIDAFVRTRLAREKLQPSPEADRPTLIRRLSLDLLGLPPKPEEVRAFVSDTSPNAYEKLVDRLLASPHFGERWGRHWLDLARYADSDGYEKDRARPFAYTFRDWVIAAINSDLPYDQFSIQQLAGDLLPNASHAQKVATGFHRQTLTNTEGGTDQEEFRCKAVVDRVSTTAAVWLGTTLGCAECHSHKYDPFTQREFYSLFAFFNNANEKAIPAPDADEQAAYSKLKQAHDAGAAKLKAALDTYAKSELTPKLDAWLKTASLDAVSWRALTPDKLAAKNGTTLKADKEAVVTAGGTLPATDTYTVEAKVTLKRLTGFRLEAIDDPDPKKGAGRSKDGNFVLTKFAVKLFVPGQFDGKELELRDAKADFEQAKFPIENALKGENTSGWAISPQQQQSHVAVFALGSPLDVPEGARLVFTLDHQYKETYLLGQFRLSATDAGGPLKSDFTPDAVAAALAAKPEQRTAKQTEALAKFFREQVDEQGKKLQAALDDHAKNAPAAPATTAAVHAEEPGVRKPFIHVRGNFLDKGTEVHAATPAVLHPLKPRAAQPDRLDLAQWLFAPENPLTARVSVNHIWKNLFGRGLVGTVEDFGKQGEKPSHPELLDWLASEFPRLGWSRKALIKSVVTSATYKQASVNRPELQERDPNNLLLARQNRLRLEAETVRDAYLTASGLLNPKIGGPSIRPPLPADIAALGYANSVKWTESKGDEKNRRGLYIFFQRTVPYPMLMTFDAPDSNTSCARRERSNTPLQALTLLNDPVFFECAQQLGARMAEVPTADAAERIRHGFERALARPPSAEELSRLLKLYEAQLKLALANADGAAKIAGAAKPTPEVAEKATLVALGRVMLNLDEFFTRD